MEAMTRKRTRTPMLQGLLGGALLTSLAGCGSGVAVVGQGGAAVTVFVAKPAGTGSNTAVVVTPAGTASSTVVVAANGFPIADDGSRTGTITPTESCSARLHCAP